MNKGKTRARKKPIEAISGFDLQRPTGPHCAQPIGPIFKKIRQKTKGKRRTTPKT